MITISKPRSALLLLALGSSAQLLGQAQGISDNARAPGRTFTDCRHCPEMIVLPGGKFLMGSPPDEPERRDNEPQRQITIPGPFAMSTTPVTWDQWESCVRDRWCEGAAIDEALRLNVDGTPNENYNDYG